MRRMTMAMLASVLAGAACQDSTAATPGADQVLMQNAAFNPFTRTIAAGTSVNFLNEDDITHTVTSDSMPAGTTAFNTSVGGKQSFQVTLTVPGQYIYHCTIHGTAHAGMHGVLIVN